MPLPDMNAFSPMTPQSRRGFEMVEISRHQPAPQREVGERLVLGDGALFRETLRVDERRRGVQRHVEEGGRPARRTRPRAGRDALPIGAARFVEMHMRVDDAGEHEQAGGVDLLARGAFGERGDFSTGDDNVYSFEN